MKKNKINNVKNHHVLLNLRRDKLRELLSAEFHVHLLFVEHIDMSVAETTVAGYILMIFKVDSWEGLVDL